MAIIHEKCIEKYLNLFNIIMMQLVKTITNCIYAPSERLWKGRSSWSCCDDVTHKTCEARRLWHIHLNIMHEKKNRDCDDAEGTNWSHELHQSFTNCFSHTPTIFKIWKRKIFVEKSNWKNKNLTVKASIELII